MRSYFESRIEGDFNICDTNRDENYDAYQFKA